MFLLYNGKAKVWHEDGTLEGNEVESGSFFGEIALVQSSNRTASVKCITDCEVIILTKAALDHVALKYPEQKLIIEKTGKQRLQTDEIRK